MIIQCDKCSTKFRLDDSRVTGNGVRVRCTKCQHVFIVAPPPPVEEVGVEEVLAGDQVSSGEFETAPKRPAPPSRRSIDDYNLKFDFTPPADGNKGAEAPPEKPLAAGSVATASSADEKKPASFDEIDFSFSTDRSAVEPSGAEEGPEEKPQKPPLETAKETAGENPLSAPWDAPVTGYGTAKGVEDETREVPEDWGVDAANEKTAEDKPPFSDLDFGTGEDKDEDAAVSGPGAGWSIETEGTERSGNEPEEGYVGSKGLAEAGQAATPQTPPQTPGEKPVPETLKFSQYFSEEMLREEMENALIGEVEESGAEGEDAGEEEREEISSNAASGRALLIAALVFLAGGAVIYFSGIIDTLAKRFMPAAQVAVEKTVDIETIKGYYTENRYFGKFFVIEATIKNISGEPQGVKAVTGLLYNSKGAKIASRSVAPGRVVSAEDLKNLSKEDLLKPFKDPSGGTLPPKGTVPVMIPFTDPPEGISEYGIDIVR